MTETLRTIFTELDLAAMDVEALLTERQTDSPSGNVRRGALETLMNLGFEPQAYIADDEPA